MDGSLPARTGATAADTPVLEVEDLRTVFLTDAGAVRAVDSVSFTVGADRARASRRSP